MNADRKVKYRLLTGKDDRQRNSGANDSQLKMTQTTFDFLSFKWLIRKQCFA